MYSRFQLAKKFLRYYLTASNGKGHGVHSPFVFDFIIHVLRDKKKYDCYQSIEKIRGELRGDKQVIEVEDFGAGSVVMPSRNRAVSAIAASSLKPKKFSQLLFRVARYYRANTIVELGTSLGITSAYLGSSGAGKVFTLEGSNNIATIAQRNLKTIGLENMKVVVGNFDETLPALLAHTSRVDLAFVDGNHRRMPTLRYFHQLLERAGEASVFIFDDIHWSEEMEEAWKDICEHPEVTLSIDLFFIGIIFFKNDFKAKQHFVIRF